MGIRNNTTLLDQRSQIDVVTRQQNLVRMQQLKQNLEAAQQMEMQYQKQLQVRNLHLRIV